MVNKIRIDVLGTCGKSNVSLLMEFDLGNPFHKLKGDYKGKVKAGGIRYRITNPGFSISNPLRDFKAEFFAHTFKVD